MFNNLSFIKKNNVAHLYKNIFSISSLGETTHHAEYYFYFTHHLKKSHIRNLKNDIIFAQCNINSFVEKYIGKYILIKEQSICGVFNTEKDAHKYAKKIRKKKFSLDYLILNMNPTTDD